MTYSRVNNRVWQAVVSNSVFHALPDSVIIRHPPTNTHLLFSHLSCLIREDHIRGYLFIRTINHDLREALTEHLKKKTRCTQASFYNTTWYNLSVMVELRVSLITYPMKYWILLIFFSLSTRLFTLYLRPLIKMCLTLCPCCAASSCTSWDPRPYWHRGMVSVARSRRTLNS